MNHLPECTVSHQHIDYLCICEQLRACEQRVLKENFCALSYNHALDSAREAVKMIHGSDMGVFDATAWIMKSAAIKAIDALRNNI